MDALSIEEKIDELVHSIGNLVAQTDKLIIETNDLTHKIGIPVDVSSSFLGLFTIFILACFIGYYVVWSVTPALHSPLMGVTNAISSVIIVGGLLAAGPIGDINFAKIMGFMAVVLASVNIFGGFIVTHRMLSMFKKKK